MSISGIEAVSGFTPLQPIDLSSEFASPAASGPAGPTGPKFSEMITNGLDRLSNVQGVADNLATQAATGDLQALHQYTVAATEAQVTTQLTVAVRNKALEAFNEVMRMPIG